MNKKEKDALFKHHFSHPSEVIDFIELYLSQKFFDSIKLSSLREVKKEYRLPDQKSTRIVDVLWEAKQKNGNTVLLHFEAQGQHEKMMMGRILTTHAAIANEYVQQGKKIPTIITFIIYHGKSQWTTPQSIAEAFEDFETYLELSLKRKLVIALPRTPIKELKKSKEAFVVLALLAKESSGDMKSIVKEVIHDIEKNKPDCCKKQDIEFLFSQNKGKDEEILEELRKFAPEITQKYTTMFERSMQKYKEIGIQEGMQKGIQQGIQQGMQSAFKILKTLGVSQSIIAEAKKKAQEK